MQLRKWAVSLRDDAPKRLFWTKRGARKFWNEHWETANLYWGIITQNSCKLSSDIESND